ncbi:hypothetical protein [Streptomyces turgidiscabies]|uniref:Uncharacterized protein n=1 Tax=Streptomyces turgidiscabies TaxID=85558 RepID=A0ABU0RGB9_9ACTN|nr:hypothetical protein [Streptomyces turgidiscabies]
MTTELRAGEMCAGTSASTSRPAVRSNFFALDIPASSARTRERFGWQPVGVGLLADLETGHYMGG